MPPQKGARRKKSKWGWGGDYRGNSRQEANTKQSDPPFLYKRDKYVHRKRATVSECEVIASSCC